MINDLVSVTHDFNAIIYEINKTQESNKNEIDSLLSDFDQIQKDSTKDSKVLLQAFSDGKNTIAWNEKKAKEKQATQAKL